MIQSAKTKVPIAVLRALRGASESDRVLHRLHSVVLVLKGFTCSEVARLYGDSARSVAYWVKRFEAAGVSGLEEEQRSGRPSRLTPAQMNTVRAFATKRSQSGKPTTGKALSSFINQKFGIHLTIRQCRRILKMFIESR
jgi:putative transposase